MLVHKVQAMLRQPCVPVSFSPMMSKLYLEQKATYDQYARLISKNVLKIKFKFCILQCHWIWFWILFQLYLLFRICTLDPTRFQKIRHALESSSTVSWTQFQIMKRIPVSHIIQMILNSKCSLNLRFYYLFLKKILFWKWKSDLSKFTASFFCSSGRS